MSEPSGALTPGTAAKKMLLWAWFAAHPNQPMPEGQAQVETLFLAIEREAATAPDIPNAWADLRAEFEAFDAWYRTPAGVNAWVGIEPLGDFYGGWAVDGERVYDEWDESEMMTASGDTPEAVIADLIGIARRYRQRRDAERAEFLADDAAYSAAEGATEESRDRDE